jgi:hypothetical protein
MASKLDEAEALLKTKRYPNMQEDAVALIIAHCREQEAGLAILHATIKKEGQARELHVKQVNDNLRAELTELRALVDWHTKRMVELARYVAKLAEDANQLGPDIQHRFTVAVMEADARGLAREYAEGRRVSSAGVYTADAMREAARKRAEKGGGSAG